MVVTCIEEAKDPLVGVQQVAEWWGMSPRTVRRMAENGRLPSFVFPWADGKLTYRFKLSDLNAYLEQHRLAQEKAS